jgi:hypothetical protein
MLLLYYDIPDSAEKVRGVIQSIAAAEEGLAVAGQMVEPHYPDGFISRAYKHYDGGNYHNGDCWTWFSNRYATVLYRLGYPRRAQEVLWSQARVAVRDQGFSEYYEDDAVGAAKGAFHYAPTAASFQLAVVEGLFGLEWDAPRKRLQVHPSLHRSGRLRLLLGGRPLELAVNIESREQTLQLELKTEVSARGDFRLWIPPSIASSSSSSALPWRVEWQGNSRKKRLVAKVDSVAEAQYVTFVCDLLPGRHSFVLKAEARE